MGPGVALCPALVFLTGFSLAVKEDSTQTIVSPEQPHIKLFKLKSSLLFVFIHRAVVRVINWNFSVCSL